MTDELYPFNAGGIGRLMYNLMRDAIVRNVAVELHVLLPMTVDVAPEAIRQYFGERVYVHQAAMRMGWAPTVEGSVVYPPAAAFTDTPWHAQSLDLMNALKHLADEGLVFDFIEFPDYRGWAFCTLQEKGLGLAFQSSVITVRLHSTAGIQQRFESSRVTAQHLGGFELERKALNDADRVIAHLEPIARYNQQFYGFDSAWLDKVDVQFPPLALAAASPRTPVASAPPNLLFVSKVQPFKRPDLFVRGAATFMRRCPAYTGNAVFACRFPDLGYWEQITRLVPADLKGRFVSGSSEAERQHLLGQGIVVLPSSYESLCLAAYEAAAAGGTLVLNGTCPAFGERTPFRDRVNCHLFDGSVEGLAEALERAWRDGYPDPLTWDEDLPYWERAQVQVMAARAPAPAAIPRVSVIITNYNLGRYLPEAIASVAASSHPDLEVIVVDDASTEALDIAMLDRMEAAGDGDVGVRVIRNPVNRGLPASRNIGIRAASGDYVLALDADDVLSPHFLTLATQALESNDRYDVVVPQAAYFRSDDALKERQFCDYAVFLGDVPAMGMAENRLSTATSLMRRALFDRFAYDETLTSFEDWELYLRLVHSGIRFLVTNAIHFYYRKREDSMVTQVDRRRHFELLTQIHLRLPRPLPPSAHTFGLMILAATQADELTRSQQLREAPPIRHQLVDHLDEALKRVPLLQPGLRRVVIEVARRFPRKG